MIVIKKIISLSVLMSFSLVLGAQQPTADITLQEANDAKSKQVSGSWWPWGKDKKEEPKAGKKVSPKKTAKKEDKTATPEEGDVYKWLQTYAEIVGLLEEKSFRTIDFAKYVQNSLKSAMASVDAHSTFFTQDSFNSVKESTSGEFSGIGVSINGKTPDDEALTVVDVIESGPAAKAGMQAGDRIVQVDGEALRGLSTDEVIAKLKGKTGTKVVIKVLRKKKKPMSFTITREIVKDQTSMCYRFIDQGIYYLSLKVFNEIAAKQMEELLVKANEGKCNGLILDLRRNPGGTMDSAIAMAGLFLDKGSLVVSTKNKKRELIQEYRTNRQPVLKTDVPIFILIDNFTASASEILAGALKHHAQQNNGKKTLRVFLVGTPTFGKGSVQELIPVKNGCAVKVTTMLYYLPDDSSIQAKGIEPDFMIKPKTIPEEEMKWINELYGKEASLKNHITVEEVDGKKDKEVQAAAEPAKEEKKSLWRKLVGDKQESKQPEPKAEEEDLDEYIFDEDEEESVKPKDNKTLEEKQREAIALDVQIQASVNMINLLNIAKKADAELSKTRTNALTFLKKNYLTDVVTSVEKVK